MVTMRTRHPQVQIRHGRQRAPVDKELALLILELWKAGWETIRSCQRHSGSESGLSGQPPHPFTPEEFRAYVALRRERGISNRAISQELACMRAVIARRPRKRKGGAQRVWIEFARAWHLEAFLNAVAPYDPAPGSLWRRAKAWGFGQIGPASEPIGARNEQEEKGAWSYHVSMTDGSYCEATGKRCADVSMFAASINVLFPRRDLATVLARLREHNKPVRVYSTRRPTKKGEQ